MLGKRLVQKFVSQEIIGGVNKISKKEITTIRIENLYAFTQNCVISK